MTKDEKIAKLGKEITDRATVLLGKDKITPDAPEYLGINSALKFTAVKYDEKMADDILDIALTMKKRVPLTIEQLAKKNPQFDRAYLEKAMQAISESGLVEFHWENLDGKNPNHEKRWVLDMFVPGSAEIMMINPEQADMFPETADFFERMAYLPLAGITEMVPPGGAGIGMHVIPVEKAIPAESKSLPIEHLSHWLKKYEGHIGVSVCSCRKQQRIHAARAPATWKASGASASATSPTTAARRTTATTSPMKRPWRSSRRPRTAAMSTRSRTSTVRTRSSASATAPSASATRCALRSCSTRRTCPPPPTWPRATRKSALPAASA
ncbi:MAG: hypothetical protein ACLSHG_02540 [Oscillospiraceae bacterium]